MQLLWLFLNSLFTSYGNRLICLRLGLAVDDRKIFSHSRAYHYAGHRPLRQCQAVDSGKIGGLGVGTPTNAALVIIYLGLRKSGLETCITILERIHLVVVRVGVFLKV